MEELDQLVLDQSGDIGAISERISMFASQRNLSRAMVAYKAFRRDLISQVTYGQLSATYRQQWRADREHTRAQAREQEAGPSYYIVRRYRLGNRIADLVQRTMRADVLSTSKAARILGVKSDKYNPCSIQDVLKTIMLYLLDANVFIDANRDYYPLDRFPEFWDWLVPLPGRFVRI